MADAPNPKLGPPDKVAELAGEAASRVEAGWHSLLQSVRDLESQREQLFQPTVELELPKVSRPKGATSQTVFLVAALKRRLAAADDGAEPTPIAREIFMVLGFDDAQAKAKADHLVRVLKKTR